MEWKTTTQQTMNSPVEYIEPPEWPEALSASEYRAAIRKATRPTLIERLGDREVTRRLTFIVSAFDQKGR
jgi:hypothetical protein